MSRVWSMMDVGKRSMMNSQTGLQTISHNIANKNTEGYSRQRVEIQAAEPVGFGKVRKGNGAWAVGVTRTNNPFIEKQLEGETNSLGAKEGRANSLVRVEQVFNEQQNKGLNKFIGEFFNAFRELSNSPESSAIRNLVKESGDFLTKDFKRVNDQLTSIQEEVDFQVGVQVQQINEITREISSLNEKIQSVEMNDRTANDERDRRDLLIKKLGEKININYAENDTGLVTITAGNTAVLVSGGSQVDLISESAPEREGKREGNVEIYYRSTDRGVPVNITKQIKSGQLGGLLEVRDGFVNELLNDMDELAFKLSSEVNRAHINGFDSYNGRGGFFFDPLTEVAGASANLKINQSILNDAGKIAAGASANSPGDNRVANLISSLQYGQLMNNGQNTFDDFYNNTVGRVGVTAARANSELQAQKDIVAQLTKIRESISGVSLDEETAKMIEFQKAYDASARLIRTADEMMDTVLNLKPM